jgi:hypothetical protein
MPTINSKKDDQSMIDYTFVSRSLQAGKIKITAFDIAIRRHL